MDGEDDNYSDEEIADDPEEGTDSQAEDPDAGHAPPVQEDAIEEENTDKVQETATEEEVNNVADPEDHGIENKAVAEIAKTSNEEDFVNEPDSARDPNANVEATGDDNEVGED